MYDCECLHDLHVFQIIQAGIALYNLHDQRQLTVNATNHTFTIHTYVYRDD